MYRILLADDEPLVLESMQTLIKKNFGETCQVQTAKTGRMVIEIAEDFRPDIAVMDIQMPGINGIDAIKEIRGFCPNTRFIVMSAYDTFDYAKSSIELGVCEYLTKPANARKIIEVLESAMADVDKAQSKRELDLKYKEKLETVVPIIESGMIYSVLFQDNYSGDTSNFKQLLDIEEEHGLVMVIEVGDDVKNQRMTNVVGASVKAQKFYMEFREIVKEYFRAIVGPVMSNKIVIFVPTACSKYEYNERLDVIERARNMIHKLTERIDMQFRVGIGSVQPIDNMMASYREARTALKNATTSVLHIKDMVPDQELEKDYPIETENRMFSFIRKGDMTGMLQEAKSFFQWMAEHYAEYITDIQLKVLELVLYAERIAFYDGGKSYHFRDRSTYMDEILQMNDIAQLEHWFIEKMQHATEKVEERNEQKFSGIITEAREYMENNYHKDISLDEVSRLVNVSPYYFSKVFKEETGENFIEYLTQIRIGHAKELLKEGSHSIKEVCMESGYSDPNYFSRIFKKSVGVTPSEYREGTIE